MCAGKFQLQIDLPASSFYSALNETSEVTEDPIFVK